MHHTSNQPMINIPSSAFGELRRELIDMLGSKRSKGFLLRYGWNCGVTDCRQMLELNWEDKRELILAGPKMHMENGHVVVETHKLEVDFENGTLHFEGDWIDSQEALQHIKLFGYGEESVCHSLVGYASGYLSELIEKQVIVRETSCIAKGDEKCHWICKTVEEWDGDPEVEKERLFFERDRISAELEETYEKLRLERDNLSKTYDVHQKLFKEIVFETGVQPIVDVLYETLKIPVVIESYNCEARAFAGISQQQANEYAGELKAWLALQQRKKGKEKQEIQATILLELSPEHRRVITPIYFRKKIHGYCSFFTQEDQVAEVDKMVLGQAALACSLHLLNEQTRFNTEQTIRGSFLDDILKKRLTMTEIVRRIHYLDFELNSPYFMAAVRRRFEKTSLQEEIEFNDEFMNDLFKYFQKKKVKALLGKKDGNVIILFSGSSYLHDQEKIDSFCRQLLSYCYDRYPACSFAMGVSSRLPSIDSAPQLYNECIASLKVANTNHNPIYFDTLGVVGMLLQTNNREALEQYAYKIVGPLMDEDKNKGMELLITLYYYLENGSNVHKTARAMNFSVNGLRYRLGKINELLQVDLNQAYNRNEIYVALQCLTALGELNLPS
ncbi:XylR N-terminal domain-containing protein [Bacillus tuaregi]|uniref:XylR N-terminal domain-containing protein n=1 Tax=Bacillus tuaregi TaxID=1816695 RepID=UPI0008F93D6F|nr:XylR N-terminal domain-containing protein [Bacillus tuaregi]